jgi:hypothetical protein
MSTTQESTRAVVVTGDVTMDWNIACERSDGSGADGWSGEKARTRMCWQRGGASLLADLVEAVARHVATSSGNQYELHQVAAPKAPVVPGDPRFHHAYNLWSLFPYSERGSSASRQVWRRAEWLGLDQSHNSAAGAEWMGVVNDPADAALVVLDDADLGFRNRPEWWPAALQGGNRPWVLLKMSDPVAQGALWEQLHREHAARLIVVMTINDLRQTEVQISRELSWERTAQDLAWELVYNPRINTLSHCAHVVVTFGAAGAMLLSRLQEPQPGNERVVIQSCLFFDPKVMEGMWEQSYPGGMTGSTSCVVAALAQQLMVAPEEPDIAQGIQNGLAALRKLHQEGYGSRGVAGAEGAVVFPIQLVMQELAANSTPFAVAEVQDPGSNLMQATVSARVPWRQGLWTILEDRYVGALNLVAQQIVLQGAEVALQGVPLGRFGALLTVDRQEIESFRSLGALVSEYCRQNNPKRPLSIAVFGAPGAGKSFGVTEVARSLLPGQIEKLEFNLSQFDAPDQLLDAFHRVRDLGLSGRIPLVFWDEFDTALENQPLGWLRHFLAPMQDGTFQEGQIAHPLGRAIFVFAGGTSESMATFDRGAGDAVFRAAKGPDFVSRLKGYVDIVGPNPRRRFGTGRYFMIRRAILLRLLLQRHAPQIFQWRGGGNGSGIQVPQIDSGVLRAFLEIPLYKHGARSMESIVTTSTLAGKSHFERSALPSEAQLNLHVDGHQFLGLVQRLELTGELLEVLAEAAHEVYRATVQGSQPAGTAVLCHYAELSEYEKEQNRQTVRDIPAKLAYAGYVMRPARSDEPPFNFPAGDREQLGELEHERWLKAMLSSGWRYGPEVDRQQKLHPALLPWHTLEEEEVRRRYGPTEGALGTGTLPESEKDKDRALVDGIPAMLARAGYTLIKIRQGNATE